MVCIILGIASCVRSAAFMHTEGNPGNLYSLNGYVAAGIWSGASFLIIGIATCSLLETQPDKVRAESGYEEKWLQYLLPVQFQSIIVDL